MDCQLPIVIDKEPVAGDRIQGAKEGVAAVDPRGRHAPAWPLHPHGANEWQEMQLRLIQGEQMAASLHRLPLGCRQGCQFGLGFLIGLASRCQPGPSPAPAGLMEQASNAGAGEGQVKPCGKTRRSADPPSSTSGHGPNRVGTGSPGRPRSAQPTGPWAAVRCGAHPPVRLCPPAHSGAARCARHLAHRHEPPQSRGR